MPIRGAGDRERVRSLSRCPTRSSRGLFPLDYVKKICTLDLDDLERRKTNLGCASTFGRRPGRPKRPGRRFVDVPALVESGIDSIDVCLVGGDRTIRWLMRDPWQDRPYMSTRRRLLSPAEALGVVAGSDSPSRIETFVARRKKMIAIAVAACVVAGGGGSCTTSVFGHSRIRIHRHCGIHLGRGGSRGLGRVADTCPPRSD